MFQPCLIWYDNSVYRMLKLVDIVGMEEIKLYVQLVLTQIYYLEKILMLRNWTMGVGLVALKLL